MTSPSLRTKLLFVLTVPIIALVVLAGMRVSDDIEARQAAEHELDEVQRVLAVESLANVVRAEREAYSNGGDFRSLAAVREDVDVAFDEILSSDIGIDNATLDSARELQERLEVVREQLGLDPDAALQAVLAEVASGAADAPITAAFTAVDVISADADALVTFDAEELISGSAASDLSALVLVNQLAEGLKAEVRSYSGIGGLPAQAIDSALITHMSSTGESTIVTQTHLRILAQGETAVQVEELLTSDTFAEIDATRADILATEPGQAVNVDLEALPGTYGPAITGAAVIRLGVLERTTEEAEVALSTAQRNMTVTLVAVSVLGVLLLVLVFAVYLSIRRPIVDVTNASLRIAEVQLPATVEAMRAGRPEDAPDIEPITVSTEDELGQLVKAFNAMSITAVELAGEQASARKVVAEMFVNLGRRNHKLVGRMLKNLDQLQKTESNAETLAQLYDIDHLATRMRRNAESLLVLAGASKTRRWKRPVPAGDVVRAALTEVEDYKRVTITAADEAAIHGDYVADCSHVLAELIENALTFSPPTENVEVVGRVVPEGYLLGVTDRGVGMSESQLAETNQRIANADDETETPSLFLGHYVVGRLAARRGITVELDENVYGGITATVLVPNSALAGAADDTPAVDESAPAAIEQAEPDQAETSEAPAPTEPAPAEPAPAEAVPAEATADTDTDPADADPAPAETEPVVSAPASPVADQEQAASRLGAARKPGQRLPETSVGKPKRRKTDVQERDPNELRDSLAGFQSGTRRADKGK